MGDSMTAEFNRVREAIERVESIDPKDRVAVLAAVNILEQVVNDLRRIADAEDTLRERLS